mmetsp:Transcript_21290/g.44637  ORF Transcript_21290/g.44637 Transcript_21290/m.44637 type:complete len:354 (+) Transcript_21290:20-1081(+)
MRFHKRSKCWLKNNVIIPKNSWTQPCHVLISIETYCFRLYTSTNSSIHSSINPSNSIIIMIPRYYYSKTNFHMRCSTTHNSSISYRHFFSTSGSIGSRRLRIFSHHHLLQQQFSTCDRRIQRIGRLFGFGLTFLQFSLAFLFFGLESFQFVVVVSEFGHCNCTAFPLEDIAIAARVVVGAAIGMVVVGLEEERRSGIIIIVVVIVVILTCVVVVVIMSFAVVAVVRIVFHVVIVPVVAGTARTALGRRKRLGGSKRGVSVIFPATVIRVPMIGSTRNILVIPSIPKGMSVSNPGCFTGGRIDVRGGREVLVANVWIGGRLAGHFLCVSENVCFLVGRGCGDVGDCKGGWRWRR